jgi:tripartite-type tricarboxylate transporter receptor subunit TctC
VLARRWRQPVTVENIPGADGILAVRSFLDQAGSDSLLLSFGGVSFANPVLHSKLPYNPDKDLPPISTVVHDVIAFLATSSLEANSLPELVRLARAKPGEISYTTAPGAPEYAFRTLTRKSGVEMVFVPYRNSIASLPDLTTGRIDVALLPLPAALGQVRAGKLRVLAIQNSERTPVLPEAPTVAESGFPELTSNGGLLLFGKQTMSSQLRERLSQEVRELLQDPMVAAQLKTMGYRPAGSTPAQAAEHLARQRATLQQMLSSVGTSVKH